MQRAIVIRQNEKIQSLIQAAGFAVTATNDPLKGVRLIFQQKPTLIVTDFHLGRIDALALVRFWSLLHLNFPMVVMVEDAEEAEAVPQSENVIAVVIKKEAGLKLGQRIAQGLKAFQAEIRPYTYRLREQEWANLMALSSRKRIMVVDDSKWLRTANLSALDETEKYCLFSADNGLDALLKSILIRPDLIITDIDMPKLNGLEMSQILFLLNQPFPIVFLTGMAESETQEKARDIEGVMGYLDKKILKKEGEFLQKVEFYLKMAESMKEALQESYDQASMEDLERSEGHGGIFRPVLKY